MEYEVIFTRLALRDLEEIRGYIARENPSVAEVFCRNLISAAAALRNFPERGGSIAERPGVRFILFDPYLIIYRLVEQSHTVRILRFWHGARERLRMRLEKS